MKDDDLVQERQLRQQHESESKAQGMADKRDHLTIMIYASMKHFQNSE